MPFRALPPKQDDLPEQVKPLPVGPHKDTNKEASIEEHLDIQQQSAIGELRPRPVLLPPPQQPRLPLGTRKLPPAFASLDEFLLLLGPRRPQRPIVLDAVEDEDSVPKDAMARFFNVQYTFKLHSTLFYAPCLNSVLVSGSRIRSGQDSGILIEAGIWI